MTSTENNPTSIGKFRLIASLGAGGMAQVYLAVASGPAGFNKLLVLKLLRNELAQDEKFRVMFLDEARLAARLNHPNVVQTYEVGEEDGSTFLAMEYLEGQPLSGVLRKLGRASFPLPAHVKILADMLAGLHHAHELRDYDGTPLRVVHRDVSPPNVMVTYEGVVKLMDFGIAAASTASQVTEAGTFKGKAAYAAPEQIQGNKVDRRADVFAVGVMLWEALTGRRLTEGKQDVQMMHQRIAGLDPPIDQAAPAAPAELRAVCARAMAQDPSERYATARDMQQALLAWLGTQGLVDLGSLLEEAFREERARLRLLVEDATRRSRESDAAPVSIPQISTTASATPSRGSQAQAPPVVDRTPAPTAVPAPPSRGPLFSASSVRWRSRPASPSPCAPPAGPTALAASAPAPVSAPAASAAPPSGAASAVASVAAPASASAAPAPAASAAPAPAASAAPASAAVKTNRADKAAPGDPPDPAPRGDTKTKKPKRAIDDGDPYAR